MDVYDSALTQTQPQKESESKNDSQSGSTSQQQPTLEQEVQQLVGGITSWWSGVSKKSQESIAQAQSHIQSQGGILNLARKELSHFESQISEAQSKAREQSLKSPQKEKDGLDPDSESKKDAKGKGKAKEEDSTNDQSDEIQVPKTTTEILDVNSPGGFNDGDSELKLDFEKSREIALKEAKNAAQFASGLFNRLANETGPRMAFLGKQLQESLNKNLAVDNGSPKEAVGGADGDNEKVERDSKVESKAGEGGEKKKDGVQLDFTQTLNSLTKTFQKSIPNLDLEKSQSLARKYLQASEKGLKEAGKEMNGLLNDLIKIVPEDGKTLEEHQQTRKSDSDLKIEKEGKKDQEGTGKGIDEKKKEEVKEEEEIFDWDNEKEDENSKQQDQEHQQQQVEASTRPETGNLSLDEKESRDHKGSDGKNSKENQDNDDDEDDDDWE